MKVLSPQNVSCTQHVLDKKPKENFGLVLTGRFPNPIKD
jgi:hypothetical protein